MQRFVGSGGEGTVAVKVVEFGGVLILVPGIVGGGVVHADVEGILLPRELVQIAQGMLGDEVCDVAGLKVERAVLDDVGLIVQAAAPADGVPVGKPVLGCHAVAHMPLA